MNIILLTAFVLFAFAANSLLCRMALSGELIDPVSFTSIRLVSGALSLLLISIFISHNKTDSVSRGSWISGMALFIYAAAFSLAYVSLSTGTGAIILFGAVQVTMLSSASRSGEKMDTAKWTGLFAALAGLVYLVFPGISAPDPIGALLMCVSGIAWSFYSIRGKGVSTPVLMTKGNFVRSVPPAFLLSIIAFYGMEFETNGVALALISGIVTSAMGYVLWYKALRSLTTTQASVVQLLVPVIAAIGGVVFLSEEVTPRLVLASILILGGVGLAVVKRKNHNTPDPVLK